MRILVTGSKGQVGRCLVNQLAKLKVEFLALDKDELDITKANETDQLVTSFEPDIVINAAAYTAVDKAETDQELAYTINRDGPKNLARAASKIGAAVLHISTDYVFDGENTKPYTENDEAHPTSVYGASKLAGEVEVLSNCERSIILRTAWVFSEFGSNFLKTMLKLGQERETLGIVADQCGGPTYAGDIASVLIHIAQKIAAKGPVTFGVYHYSGEPYVSWYDFAEYIFNTSVSNHYLKQKPILKKLSTSEYPTPAQRPKSSRLNAAKITKEFGVKPCDWKSSIENIII